MARRFVIAALLSSALAAASPAPWGAGEVRGEDLAVSLVTFGPGDDVPSWFGHSALVVEDRRLAEARLYNYGMFSFDETMLLRFVMGRLEFWVDDAPVGGTIRLYQSLNRSVRVQELNLSPAQRVSLAKSLADNVLPENRTYLYHHYRDNCATRPRDMIDRAIDGQLIAQTSVPARLSLRGHTRRHSAPFPPLSVLLDYWMNDEIDQPIAQRDEAFLPAELEQQVARTQIRAPDGRLVPLVARSTILFTAKRAPVPDEPPAYGPWLLAIGVGGGALAVLARRRRVLFGVYQALLGLVIGLPALALFFMWTLTEHTVTWRNENLLLANPLSLVPLVAGVAHALGRGWAARWLLWTWSALAATGLLALVVKALPWFDQDNWRLVMLLLPISLGSFAALLFLRRAPQVEGGGSTSGRASPRSAGPGT